MRAKLYLLFICIILILAGVFGCSPAVHVDRDESTNLSAFHSFKFVDGGSDTIEAKKDSNPLYQSSLLDRSIHAEIASQLKSRGLAENKKSPDILVAYHTFTQQKQDAAPNYPMMYGGWGWQYYPGLSPYPYGFWNGYNSTFEYTEGTLIIDVINAKTKVLVWRGSISDAVADPSNLHTKATDAVKKIFKKFPLKSQSI
jgi:hypothetical protein